MEAHHLLCDAMISMKNLFSIATFLAAPRYLAETPSLQFPSRLTTRLVRVSFWEIGRAY